MKVVHLLKWVSTIWHVPEGSVPLHIKQEKIGVTC